MPFRPEHSLLRVEVPALHTIDTTSVENLFGMWSLFSKTSHAMEDGKRLENLSWRLWNRETFCCVPSASSHRAPIPITTSEGGQDIPVPALSSSLDSVSSDDEDIDRLHPQPRLPKARPELRRHDSTDSRRLAGRTPKHLTPIDLEKMVISIKETKELEPIDLPISTPAFRATTSPAVPSTTTTHTLANLSLDATTATHSSPPPASHPPPAPRRTNTVASQQSSVSQSTLLESSTSTVYTSNSHKSDGSQTVGSQDSSATEMSTHSIVRGFVPGGVPSSYRSQTHLNPQPTAILKTSPSHSAGLSRKKGAVFTIGTSSSSPDESSLETHMYKGALSNSLKRGGMTAGSSSSTGNKKTSFREEVAIGRAAEHSPVFESDDEDEDVSESAIEEDDDSSDWEDSEDQSGPSSMNEKELFQRVDSRPQLASRRSLLTTLMHEPDRARALANAASRSTPAMRRSRTSTPNGPSGPASPDPDAQPLQHAGPSTIIATATQPRPIMINPAGGSSLQLALSPRTTRRNMLSTELTESLRKNLLWERQHRSNNNLAALKRRYTSNDVKNLRQHPEPGPVFSQDGPRTFTNDYFNAGLGEYHYKGW